MIVDPYALVGIDLSDFVSRPRWMLNAACRGMDTEQFFPTRGEPTAEARAICATCSVRVECLDYAMQRIEHGVWADTTARDRRKLRNGRTLTPSRRI